jgi:hypothetical protein
MRDIGCEMHIKRPDGAHEHATDDEGLQAEARGAFPKRLGRGLVLLDGPRDTP